MKFNIREFRLSRKMLLILGVVVTIFLVGVYVSRFRSTSAQANVTLQKKPLFNQKRFRLSYVKRRSLERWAVIPGIVHAFRKAKIYAHVPGYLKFLNVDKGDFVRRGQVLAYIYDPELYQSYQKSLAEAEIAKITFERKKKVWEGDHRVISLENVQKAEAIFREKEAKARYDHELVRYKTIVAPFDGIITHRYIDPWNLISEGTGTTGHALPLLKESYVDTMRLYVGVPESEVRYIRRGLRVWLEAQGLKGRKFDARVTRYDYALDHETRTMRTEIDILNPDKALMPRMYVWAHILLKTYKNTLSIPKKAVIEGRHGDFAFVIRDGKVQQVPIVVGDENGGYVQILQGLTESEPILVKLHATIY
ncbi:efflux RND transporter periplasmic adaptor subunit [Leptospirillum ferriphilum]|jgi:RND family efflux transporter MFP subunit|uniref:RND family efflux transporter, MFP subunit n=2 Tax=Leptospirillum TaxID=179 RepID=A0A2I2MJ86_9BACT|nr:efflux RND transporter periplasmic adaptor subunit [Leptospirillum ferriphilum]EDZ40079.1 MAG: Secretion protein HlyD [Leptospirillum sp. Group II '5-way CG']